MKRFIGAVLVSLSVFGGLSGAQHVDIAAIEAFVTAQMARHALPGVAIAITEGDRRLYSNAWGAAGGGRPLTPDTPMYIGSISKSFTALAIAQLAEQGRLDLGAPVVHYLPDFTLADPEATREITVRQLLHHASGLSDLQYLERGHLPDSATIAEGVGDLRRARPVAPPGSRFYYFNPGYTVLGHLVEQVSGQPYEDYLRAHILMPLAMHRTFTDAASAKQAGLAQGHSLMFGFNVPRAQPFRHYRLPAGYLISTANDMANYLIAMNGGGHQLLSPDGMAALHRPYGPGSFYAQGWMVGSHRGLRLVQHGGSNEFFKSEAMLLPERGLGLVVLINQGYLPSAFTAYPELGYGLLDLLLGEVPTSGVPMALIGRLLFVVLIAIVVYNVWQLATLRRWCKRAAGMSCLRRRLDIATHFLVGPLIIIGVMLAFRLYQQRGFAWQQSFDGFPDGVVLLVVGILGDYLCGAAKLWLLRKGNVAGAA
jgi:CubicO group peptidase (beta-lactamase class C family)